MKGYKIYLTRSTEVADLIATAKEQELKDGKVVSVRRGCAYGCDPDVIPGMYRTIDYEYCLVEYDNPSCRKYGFFQLYGG